MPTRNFAFAIIAVLLSAAALQAQDVAASAAPPTDDVIPLSQVPLDIYQLKKWGDRDYIMFSYRIWRWKKAGVMVFDRIKVPVGPLRMQTDVGDEKIVLHELWQDPDAEKGWAQMTYECQRNNLLTLDKMTYRFKEEFVCDFTDGNYEMQLLGEPRSGKWPLTTVSEPSLFRLVTLLPRTPGARFRIDKFSLVPDIQVLDVADDPILCVGPEEITIRGKTMKCVKFSFRNYLMWVRPEDNVLARVEQPGKRIIEISERDMDVFKPAKWGEAH